MNWTAKKYIILIMFILLPGCALNINAEPEVFIRFNQLGYLPGDVKTAVVLANHILDGKPLFIIDYQSKQKVLQVEFSKSKGEYGSFQYLYEIDFSTLNKNGEYQFQFAQQKSTAFKVSPFIYEGIADTLLKFMQVQRCGYTDPLLHKVCHISDATRFIEGAKNSFNQFDVTGGWHDAGDYVKFFNTTAFTTYMLLFSYEFDPVKFGFDNNRNNTPDILEEAKIGLDWLLRANYNGKFVTQVQDLRDHDVGWRMPEDDPLGFDRPAFVGIGKNLIGIYAATMSLAYRIWKDKFQLNDFANKCLESAEKMYAVKNRAADIDSSGSGMYIDNSFEGKLALGAVELYISTNKSYYLDDAALLADSAGADHWWSWGNINSLAHYKIAKFIPRFSDYIKLNLEGFEKNMGANSFGKGTTVSWGTNVTLLGVTLQNILYKKLKQGSQFETVAAIQKDFILGRNAWGISFINGVGKTYARNFHHQVLFFKKKLPGGFAAGPASKDFMKNYNIKYEKYDNFARFQSNDSYYRDDRNDYITNEPTITGNATAIFVYGNLIDK